MPPADDMGPALVWYRTNARTNFVRLAGILVLFSLLASISIAAGGGPFVGWVNSWQVWLFVIVMSLLAASPFKIQTQAAGADWFMSTYFRLYLWWLPRPPVKYLYTYEIIRITAHAYGETGIFLKFLDQRGNTLEKKRDELQKDQKIWDLLYNGILHSLADGAQMDPLAQKWLEIPIEAKQAKWMNWQARKPMPNWPPDLPFPDPETGRPLEELNEEQ